MEDCTMDGGFAFDVEAAPSLRRPLPVISPADRAHRLGERGPRLLTGIDSLDRATRGGLRLGRRVVLGGAPGAGKTTLAVNLAHRWAAAGYCIAILAADEDADGILMRWGQLEGLHRDDLEREGTNDAKRSLGAIVGRLGDRLLLADADEAPEGEFSVDAISADLLERRQSTGAPGSVLILDSIQTVDAAGTEEAESPRLRADAVLRAMKRAAKRDGHLVLATSEVGRGAYRSSNPNERVNDLAAFKESGGIEFKADVALVLRSVKGCTDQVDVAIPKNRLRGVDLVEAFRLELDRRAARFREVPVPTAEDEAAAEDSREAAMRERVLTVIDKTIAPLQSRSAIYERLKGTRGVTASKRAWLRQIRELEESEGVIGKQDGRYVVIGSRFGTGSEPAAR